MKRIAVFLIAMLISSNCHAEIISRDTLDASSTIDNIATILDTIINEVNGNLDSNNIKNDSLAEKNFSDNINPRVRDYEFLGDFTYTGQLPITSATVSTTISAGTSYVKGYRIVTATTGKTYTASKDTWTYIDQNGAFQYVEVATGAAQPVTPTNSLLLAKVSTSASAVTSVTDKRTTAPPGIRTYEKYRVGYIMSRDVTSPNAQLTISAGEIDLGSSGLKRLNTTATTVTWTDIDTGTEAASQSYFLWAYPSTSNSTEAAFKISVSSTDCTGVTNERLVGWFWNDSQSNITSDNISTNYKGDGSGVPNIAQRYMEGAITTTATSFTDIDGLTVYFWSSGRPVRLNLEFDCQVSAGITTIGTGFSVDGGDVGTKISNQVNAGYNTLVNNGYVMCMPVGLHTIKGRVYVNANTLTINRRSLAIEEI